MYVTVTRIPINQYHHKVDYFNQNMLVVNIKKLLFFFQLSKLYQLCQESGNSQIFIYLTGQVKKIVKSKACSTKIEL